nr:MAG TPA: hypothetical protein [Caudoviricetes sp.]
MDKPSRKKYCFRNCIECNYRLTMCCFKSISSNTCYEGHRQYSRLKATADELKRLRETLTQ